MRTEWFKQWGQRLGAITLYGLAMEFLIESKPNEDYLISSLAKVNNFS